jgi:NAD(P)-dependent dehydrogenase (short-subunit alcohol dehydrogenase family)
MSLAGRTALITGAGGGIGSAVRAHSRRPAPI